MLKSRGEACLCNAMDVVPSLTSIWGVSRGLQRAQSSYSHGVSFLALRKLSWWKKSFLMYCPIYEKFGCSPKSLICLEITSVSSIPIGLSELYHPIIFPTTIRLVILIIRERIYPKTAQKKQIHMLNTFWPMRL